ncbi:hypothetical protein EV1_000439 [Malus domestica]
MAIFAASYVEAQLSLCMGQSNYDNGVIVFFLLGKWALRGYLLPLRGFRQGDLLSPYLFHLCTKGFLALLADREWAGLIQGVSIRNGVPLAYELASGQKINLHKSKICFSRNVKRLDKAQMASVNGASVHIWEDSWVPFPHFLRLISSKLNLGTISWVADLIDHSSHSWKSDLFSQLFSTDEADLIQGIPLNICNSDDRLIWHHNWSIAFMDCPMESKCSSQGSGLLLENV